MHLSTNPPIHTKALIIYCVTACVTVCVLQMSDEEQFGLDEEEDDDDVDEGEELDAELEQAEQQQYEAEELDSLDGEEEKVLKHFQLNDCIETILIF